MIIFDEKKYAEQQGMDKVGYRISLNKPIKDLVIYGKYLKYLGHELEEIKQKLIDASSDSTIVNRLKSNMFYDIIDRINSVPLCCDKSVSITKNELDQIKMLNNNVLERIMFVMLVVQKFLNTNYVFINISQLQCLCKTNYNTIYFDTHIIKDLVDKEYLVVFRINSKLFKINIRNDQSPEAMVVRDFDNMINDYLSTCKSDSHIYCSVCGKKTRRTGRRQVYCNDCSRLENIKKTSKNKKKFDL